MTDAQYTYMWLIVALTVGVTLMGIGAALIGILPTRAERDERAGYCEPGCEDCDRAVAAVRDRGAA